MEQATVQPAISTEDLFIGEWLVQPSLGVVSRPSLSNHLEPKTMQVLMCLAAHPGAVVSKDDLMRAVWPETFVTEHVLTQAIWQLRRAFGDIDVIQTISRRGYRIIAPVRPAVERKPTLAVLPIVNFSGDAEQEYFADGMTESLISALAQIAALRVISRTSVMQYKGTKKSVPQITAELKVDHVVEGSVVRAGDHVRISVQLIRSDDVHLWAKNYDRDMRDVLRLQDDVARAIAAEIQINLTPDEQNRLLRSRPVNPVAHELYLKGRYCYFRTTEEALRMSIDFMQQAIAADPLYAPAHAGLASSAALLSSSVVSSMSPLEALRIVRPATSRALELDPELAEAHFTLGWIKLFCEWDWAAAEKLYEHAIALTPSSSVGYGTMAWIQIALNRTDKAIAAWEQACALDPLSLFFQTLHGFTLAISGHLQEAAEQLRRTISFEPNYYYPRALLSATLSLLDRHEEAISEAETALRLCPAPSPRAYVGYTYARAGRTDDARRVLREILELSKTRYVSGLMPAAILAALGEFDSAIDHLESAQQNHDSDIVFIRVYPPWRPLHGHPRFEQLVQRMKFPN